MLVAQVSNKTTFTADSLAPPGKAVILLDTSAVTSATFSHPTFYLASALRRRFSRPLHFVHLAVDEKSSRVVVVATSAKDAITINAFAKTVISTMLRPPSAVVRLHIAGTEFLTASTLRATLAQYGEVSFLAMRSGRDDQAQHSYGEAATAVLRVPHGVLVPGNIQYEFAGHRYCLRLSLSAPPAFAQSARRPERSRGEAKAPRVEKDLARTSPEACRDFTRGR